MTGDMAPYITVLSFLGTGSIFLSLTFLISRMLRPNKPYPSKLSTYECGEEAVGSGQIQFNSRFFVIAILFVLFEVEMIFLFPWTFVTVATVDQAETNRDWNLLAFLEMVVFVLILALGLAYAWAKGHLEWVKPETKPKRIASKIPLSSYSDYLK